MIYYRLKLAGISYRVKENPDIGKLRPERGDTLQLEAEPTNEHDKEAVKVMFEGNHIGYLPATSKCKKLFNQGKVEATRVLDYACISTDDNGEEIWSYEGTLMSMTIVVYINS